MASFRQQSRQSPSAAANVWTILPMLLLAGSVAAQTGPASTTSERSPSLPDAQAWEAGPDRETLVRFARAWGLVASLLDSDAPGVDPLDDEVAEPDALSTDVGREVKRHISNNGLDSEQWASLMARMDADPDFRTRVEMLASPYRTPLN